MDLGFLKGKMPKWALMTIFPPHPYLFAYANNLPWGPSSSFFDGGWSQTHPRARVAFPCPLLSICSLAFDGPFLSPKDRPWDLPHSVTHCLYLPISLSTHSVQHRVTNGHARQASCCHGQPRSPLPLLYLSNPLQLSLPLLCFQLALSHYDWSLDVLAEQQARPDPSLAEPDYMLSEILTWSQQQQVNGSTGSRK